MLWRITFTGPFGARALDLLPPLPPLLDGPAYRARLAGVSSGSLSKCPSQLNLVGVHGVKKLTPPRNLAFTSFRIPRKYVLLKLFPPRISKVTKLNPRSSISQRNKSNNDAKDLFVLLTRSSIILQPTYKCCVNTNRSVKLELFWTELSVGCK